MCIHFWAALALARLRSPIILCFLLSSPFLKNLCLIEFLLLLMLLLLLIGQSWAVLNSAGQCMGSAWAVFGHCRAVPCIAGHCEVVQGSVGQCRELEGNSGQCRSVPSSVGKCRSVRVSAGQCVAVRVIVGQFWVVLGSAWQYKRKSSAAHVTEVLQHFSLVDN